MFSNWRHNCYFYCLNNHISMPIVSKSNSYRATVNWEWIEVLIKFSIIEYESLDLGHGSRWYRAITRFYPDCLFDNKYHRVNWSMIISLVSGVGQTVK